MTGKSRSSLDLLYLFVIAIVFLMAVIAGLATGRIEHPPVSTPTTSSSSSPTPSSSPS